MKKSLTLLGVGFLGLSSLQGCMSAVGDGSEELGSASAEVTGACYTNSGLMPTKAALAVAMATELRRWSPNTDLVSTAGTGWLTTLTATGLAQCTNGCKNTKAILGQQDTRINQFIDQNVFSASNMVSDLNASLGRQVTLIQNLTQNNKSQLPPAHKLTLVGGPVNLGVGACGPHYVFQADRLDGTPLTATEATNLGNTMCFYGFGSCGSNPYIKYATTTQGCPTGRTCVAVDPTDGDNGSGTTTTAGSIPTYPLNRLYDPTSSKLNTQCLTTASKLGKMLSKCSAIPTTCGYLYCVAP